MGIAGLSSNWRGPDGKVIDSFTMLTINADHHSLMSRFHKPGEEKRMVVILPRSRWKEWMLATPERLNACRQPSGSTYWERIPQSG